MRKIKDCYKRVEKQTIHLPKGTFEIYGLEIELYKGLMYLNVNKNSGKLFVGESKEKIDCYYERIKNEDIS